MVYCQQYFHQVLNHSIHNLSYQHYRLLFLQHPEFRHYHHQYLLSQESYHHQYLVLLLHLYNLHLHLYLRLSQNLPKMLKEYHYHHWDRNLYCLNQNYHLVHLHQYQNRLMYLKHLHFQKYH